MGSNIITIMIAVIVALFLVASFLIYRNDQQFFRVNNTFIELEHFWQDKLQPPVVDYILLQLDIGQLTLIVNPESDHFEKKFDEYFTNSMFRRLVAMLKSKGYSKCDSNDFEGVAFTVPLNINKTR